MAAAQVELMVRAGAPVAAALVGGLAGASAWSRRGILAPLVHFAAGAFLGLALLDLLPEAAVPAGWAAASAAALLGAVLTLLLGRWAGARCPACAAGRERGLQHRLGAPLLCAVGLHCLLDGFPLSGAGTSAHGAEILSAALVLHKVPEGLAIAALARAGGRSAPAALALTAAIESLTLVGAFLGLAAGSASAPLLGAGLALVAGSFIALAAGTLWDLRGAAHPRLNLGAAAAGALLMAAARFVTS